MIGRITFWNDLRGFGFITVTTREADATFQTQYFFHYSNFVDCNNGNRPAVGSIVRFNLGEPLAEGKKVQGINVRYATAEEIAVANMPSALVTILSQAPNSPEKPGEGGLR